MQAELYARSVIDSTPTPYPASKVDGLVAARMKRQERVIDGSLKLWVILDEAVLYRPIGGWEVFDDQLKHLILLRRKVMSQVLRRCEVWRYGQNDSFVVMNFEDGAPIVFVDSVLGELPIDGEAEVTQFQDAFDHLRAFALGPDESIELISETRAALRAA